MLSISNPIVTLIGLKHISNAFRITTVPGGTAGPGAAEEAKEHLFFKTIKNGKLSKIIYFFIFGLS